MPPYMHVRVWAHAGASGQPVLAALTRQLPGPSEQLRCQGSVPSWGQRGTCPGAQRTEAFQAG